MAGGVWRMWRPGSPAWGPRGTGSKVRWGLRSAAYALGCLSLLSLLQASTLVSVPIDQDALDHSPPSVRHQDSSEGPVPAQGQPSEPPEPSPRFRRNILAEEGPEDSTDLFISVKTTGKYHKSRVADILDTWFRLAPSKIWFFTDQADGDISERTDGHLIVTNCSASHRRQALCCKMGAELDFFLRSGKSWMCHFDDDNYVNVGELERVLAGEDPEKDLYIGRPSTRDPITIADRSSPDSKISFWFATGGAGFCVSRGLGRRMGPLAGSGAFEGLGERIRLPDDVTMGYLAEHLLGSKLQVHKAFHSHLESMAAIPTDQLRSQVSLSAGSYSGALNVVAVPVLFPATEDERRFRSLHCFLFPHARLCPASSQTSSQRQRPRPSGAA